MRGRACQRVAERRTPQPPRRLPPGCCQCFALKELISELDSVRLFVLDLAAPGVWDRSFFSRSSCRFSATAAPAAMLLHHQISATCPALPLTRLEWAEDVQGDLLTLLTFYSNENDYCQGSSEPRDARPHTDVVKMVAPRPSALETLERLKRSVSATTDRRNFRTLQYK